MTLARRSQSETNPLFIKRKPKKATFSSAGAKSAKDQDTSFENDLREVACHIMIISQKFSVTETFIGEIFYNMPLTLSKGKENLPL